MNALLVLQVSQHSARTAALMQWVEVVPGAQLVVMEEAPELSLARPRRMFLYKIPKAQVMSLYETIGPGSLELDPGQEGGGVGGGSDEEGQCFADVTCGTTCALCDSCECLMDDGRNLECKMGKCKCTKHCNCDSTADCPMACGLDYSPDLCGQKQCRAGKCYEVFDLPLEDPDWDMRRAR
jgi:hypothetical protein